MSEGPERRKAARFWYLVTNDKANAVVVNKDETELSVQLLATDSKQDMLVVKDVVRDRKSCVEMKDVQYIEISLTKDLVDKVFQCK